MGKKVNGVYRADTTLLSQRSLSGLPAIRTRSGSFLTFFFLLLLLLLDMALGAGLLLSIAVLSVT